MTETEEVKAPAPAKKKRKVQKRAAAAPKPKVEANSPFAGLTVSDCCLACNVNGCVISGKSYCAHPRKGGLHAAEMHDDGAMRRRRAAERYLGNQKLVVE